MSSKGRTEHQISLSRAKNCEEVAGDVRFCVAPQKSDKNYKKLNFSTDFSEFFRTRPNASESIQMHPSASGRIRTGPGRSEQVRNPRKTCESLQKLDRLAIIFAKACFAFIFLLIVMYCPEQELHMPRLHIQVEFEIQENGEQFLFSRLLVFHAY